MLFLYLLIIQLPQIDSKFSSTNEMLANEFRPTNFPAGHHRLNVTLPIGAEVEVDAKRKRLVVLAPPVTVDKR